MGYNFDLCFCDVKALRTTFIFQQRSFQFYNTTGILIKRIIVRINMQTLAVNPSFLFQRNYSERRGNVAAEAQYRGNRLSPEIQAIRSRRRERRSDEVGKQFMLKIHPNPPLYSLGMTPLPGRVSPKSIKKAVPPVGWSIVRWMRIGTKSQRMTVDSDSGRERNKEKQSRAEDESADPRARGFFSLFGLHFLSMKRRASDRPAAERRREKGAVRELTKRKVETASRRRQSVERGEWTAEKNERGKE